MQKFRFIIMPAFVASIFLQQHDSAGSNLSATNPLQEESFLMPVEDVFSLTGRGTVVTGIIERGQIKAGDPVEIIGLTELPIRSIVTAVEMFNKLAPEGKKGDTVGLLLRGVEKSQVSRGMVVCKPSSVATHTEFKCELSLKTKEEGGRSTPVANQYRPQFVFRTAIISGAVRLPPGKVQLQPGETALVSILVSVPVVMEKNMEFSIREIGRIVGTGKIIEIIK